MERRDADKAILRIVYGRTQLICSYDELERQIQMPNLEITPGSERFALTVELKHNFVREL